MKTFSKNGIKLEHWVISYSILGLVKWVDLLNHKVEYRFFGIKL